MLSNEKKVINEKEQFEDWVKQWEVAQSKFSSDKVEVKEKQTYFGLNVPALEEEDLKKEESLHWRDVFYKALKINPEVFNEEEEGFRKDLTGPGKDVKFQHNPIHHASVGMDQSPSPYDATRVTPNFTDGDELRKLHELKIKLEKLESALQTADVRQERKGDYKDELDKLRKQIDGLSDKLLPEPARDIT